jgi:hypothetical protein
MPTEMSEGVPQIMVTNFDSKDPKQRSNFNNSFQVSPKDLQNSTMRSNRNSSMSNTVQGVGPRNLLAVNAADQKL